VWEWFWDWPWDRDGGGLPRSSVDIPWPEGSPVGLRGAAEHMRGAADALDTAHVGCDKLAAIRGSTSAWSGEGYTAFVETMNRGAQPSDVSNAQDVWRRAADACDALADGIEDCQQRIDWCRRRIDDLCLPPGELGDDQRPVVEAIAADAHQAHEDYRRHVQTAEDTFGSLADATVHAEPPPSFWDCVGDSWSWGWHNARDAWNGFFDEGAIFDRVDDLHNPLQAISLAIGENAALLVGLRDGLVEMWDGFVTAAVLTSPQVTTEKIELWNRLAATYQYARQDFRQFEEDMVRAVIDYDTLRRSPGQWTGKLIPSLAVAAIPYAGPAASATSRGAAIAARITHRALSDEAGGTVRISDPLIEAAGGSLAIEGSAFSASEVRIAIMLARQGNEVIVRRPTRARRTSDLLVNGTPYDVYTPTTGDIRSIVIRVAEKGSQVDGGGVVIDLSRSPLTAADLGDILPRVQEATDGVSDIIVFD
jgi:hypothetical protein